MRTQEIESKASTLKQAITRFKTWANNDQLASELATYCCVLLCALLEDAIKTLIITRAQKTHDKEVVNYIEKSVAMMRNPKRQTIKEQLGKFSQEYVDLFDVKVPPNGELHNTIDSIVNIKNGLSHTVGHSYTLTLNDTDRHFDAVKELLSIVEDILLDC